MINFQQAVDRLITPGSVWSDAGKRPAVIHVQNTPEGQIDRIVSFAELETLIRRTYAKYRELGVKPGDSVLLSSPNNPELAAAIFAAWVAGATAIPVDFRLTQSEVENIARRVNTKVVYAPRFNITEFKTLPESTFKDESINGSDDLTAHVKPETPGLVILTSGTTGMPKGAVHDLDSLIGNVLAIGKFFGLQEGKPALLPLPISHIFGIEVMLAVMVLGGPIVLCDFTPQGFWPCIEKHKPALVIGVPTIYSALLNLPRPNFKTDLVDHYVSGGAPLPPSLSDDFKKAFGRPVCQGYGATETKIVSINKNGPVSSVGLPVPSVKIEIVDDQDRVLPDGETGEIRIAGQSLMQGYLHQPDVTAQVLHDGHYHTGDIGYIKDGWVYISGRSKEMIIVAGNKIFPNEVESVLRSNPLTCEVAVVGPPHKKLGQIVKAVIVLKPGEWTDRILKGEDERKVAEKELEAQYREFCKENLKRELRPMDWEFRPATSPLPKTHTGKIDKKLLQPVPV